MTTLTFAFGAAMLSHTASVTAVINARSFSGGRPSARVISTNGIRRLPARRIGWWIGRWIGWWIGWWIAERARAEARSGVANPRALTGQ